MSTSASASTSEPPTAKRTALVTGCSEGGIGEVLVRRLAAQDYRVFATVRSPAKGAYLKGVKGVSVLVVDVSAPSSVAEFAARLRRRLAPHGGLLHLLVNNAGRAMMGPVLDADLEQAKRLLDTNVWGLLAVTQVCAYSLIAAKGTVVNVSSIGGLFNLPWYGLYSASKAAVSVLSETMRVELAPLGVRVVTAVLGRVQTRFHTNADWAGIAEGSFYKDIESQIERMAQGEAGPKKEPVDKVVDELLKEIEAGATGFVYRGAMAQAARFASHLPPQLIDSIFKTESGLEEFAKQHKLKTD